MSTRRPLTVLVPGLGILAVAVWLATRVDSDLPHSRALRPVSPPPDAPLAESHSPVTSAGGGDARIPEDHRSRVVALLRQRLESMKSELVDQDHRLEEEARALPGLFVALALDLEERDLRVLCATILLRQAPEVAMVEPLLKSSKDHAVLIIALTCMPAEAYGSLAEAVARVAMLDPRDARLFSAAMSVLSAVDPERVALLVADLLESGADEEILIRAAAFLRSVTRQDLAGRLIRAWVGRLRAMKRTLTSGEDPILAALARMDVNSLELLGEEALKVGLEPSEMNLYIYGMRQSDPEFAIKFLSAILDGGYPVVHKRQAIFALAHVSDSKVVDDLLRRLCATPAQNPLWSDLVAATSLMNPALLDPRRLAELRTQSVDPSTRTCLAVLMARCDLKALSSQEIEAIRSELETCLHAGVSSPSVLAAEGLAAISMHTPGGGDRMAGYLKSVQDREVAFDRLVKGASRCDYSADLLRSMQDIGCDPRISSTTRLDALQYVLRVGDSESQAASMPSVVQMLADKRIGLQFAIQVGENCKPETLRQVRDTLRKSAGSDPESERVLSLIEDFMEKEDPSENSR